MSSFRKQETPKGVEQILPKVDFYYQRFPAQKMKMSHQNDCENLASFKVRQVSREKNPYYFPLYCLFTRDPYNGVL